MFGFFRISDKGYAGGGFALYNADGEKVGAVITIADISSIEASFKQAGVDMLIIAVIATLIISAVMVFLVTRVVISPLDKVVDATTRVAGGDFSAKFDVKSNDEIGQLAKLISQFRDIMVNTARELKNERAKRR